MTFVFFIYGLAFFSLGLAIFIYPKKDSAFKFANNLGLIGTFGILHGISEWVDVFLLIQGSQELLVLKIIRAFIGPVSYIFLIQFGVKIIAENKKALAWLKGLTFILPSLWVAIFGLTQDRFLYGDIWGRYLLGFPGASLTACALLQLSNFKDVKLISVKRNFKRGAFVFAFYAVLAGIIVPKVEFLPASVLNYALFQNTFGFPVQVLRALAAVLIAISLGRVLSIFNWETRAKLKEWAETLEKRVQERTKELNVANEELQTTNEELKSTTEELEASNEEIKSANEELEASNEELRETQEKLVQKEKLAAVGQLASGVGHELRNPIGVIKNAVYYIKTKIPQDDEKLTKHTNIMEREITTATKLVEDLLSFSKTRKPLLTLSNIADVIEDAIGAVALPENIRVVKEFKKDLKPANIDRDQIRQVLVNLILNASQAMSEAGGMITIGANQVDNTTSLYVKDTGSGIPQENINKLFDPFFTTKARGVGLGLAVCHGIIERHNGKIEIKSKVGSGSTFTLVLPS